MNRTAALDYLTNEYAEMLTESNLDADASLRAYSTAIDQALRILGYPESELGATDVTDEITEYTALLDYFALSRFARVFAMRSDVSVSGAISASQSQTYKQVKELLDGATTRLAGLGVSTTQTFQSGRFTLDFLEPDLLTEGMG